MLLKQRNLNYSAVMKCYMLCSAYKLIVAARSSIFLNSSPFGQLYFILLCILSLLNSRYSLFNHADDYAAGWRGSHKKELYYLFFSVS